MNSLPLSPAVFSYATLQGKQPTSPAERCSAKLRIYNPGQKGLGHFPLFSLFYVETEGNQQFTVIKIALKRFFPRSP